MAVLSRIPDQIRDRLNELGFGLIFRHPTPDTHCQASGMFAITDVGLEVEYADRISFGFGDIACGDVHDVVSIGECPAEESFQVTSWGGPCSYGLLSRKPLPQRERAVCLNRALFVLVSALHDALNGCLTVTTNDLAPSRNDKLTSALENLSEFPLVIMSPASLRETIEDVDDVINWGSDARLIGRVQQLPNGNLLIGDPERTGG
jgi:hypothetical protein